MELSDFELVDKCLSGDKEAFRPLVERYQQMVFNTICKMVFNSEVSRDLCQEVFMKAYTKLSTFNSRYPFYVWIHRIAINRTIDFLRRKKPEYLLLDKSYDADADSPPMQIADEKPTPYNNAQSSESINQIRQAVSILEPNLRAIIVLRHFQEMSYFQIAETLSIPIGTVKNRLFRAREKLQDVLFRNEIAREVR